MNLINNLTGKLSDEQASKIHWGGAMALWDICRHKVIGVPVLDIFYENAKDSELKSLIGKGIENVAIPHIEKLQKLLVESELTCPSLPHRKGIDDQQIARAIKEILRLSLSLDFQAFLVGTREDIRSLVWSITNEDKKAFDEIMELNRKKGWMLNPPNIN